jgi:hypothetical protein
LFTNTALFIYVFNVYLPNFGFVCKHWNVYLRFQCLYTFVSKHWFVYLHSQCLFTKFWLCLQTLVCLFTFSMFIYVCFQTLVCLFTFSMFIYKILALFTNISLFIYVFNVYIRLFPNTGLFIYVFNVYIRNFGFVSKHWFVYLRFQRLYTEFSLCLQTLICLFTISTFIYGISALFTNTGLFIYKFWLCLQTLVCLFTF